MVSLGLALAAAVDNVRNQRRFSLDDPDRPDTRGSSQAPSPMAGTR